MTTLTKYLKALMIGMMLTMILMQMPIASSSTNPESLLTEKASLFAVQVAGIDLSKYTVQTQMINNDTETKLYDSAVKLNLTSAQSSLEILNLFRDGKLIWCKLYPIEGKPLFNEDKSLISATDAVKNVVDKLQNYTKASYISTMKNLVEKISDSPNSTLVNGDIRQITHFSTDYTSIQWTHNSNNIQNSYKSVVLTLKNSNFEFFCDNWDLYKIGDSNTAISYDRAIQIAKQHAIDKYSTSASKFGGNFTILDKSANIHLAMQDRGNYTLYPNWEILLPLDKAYGAVTCIQVNVWADTGEVSFNTAVGNYGSIPSNLESYGSASQNTSIIRPESILVSVIVIAIASTIIAACFVYRRKK